MSQSRLALITFVDGSGGGYPDNSLPGGPVYPGQGLPVYPSTGPILPPGGVTLPVFPFDPTDPGYGQGHPGNRPDNSLPGRPNRPDNSLPGSGGRPDNSLPGSSNRPDQGLPSPGKKYVVKWLASVGLILVPDNELPSGGRPDQELPETPEPK